MTNAVPAPPTDPPNTRDGSRLWWIRESHGPADLWHIILNGDFPPVAKNKVTQILEVVPFEEQSDDLKKKLAKNNEAKMVLYNALPKKEYERIFMCKTAKDIWQSLLITHQGNSQVKDNKIDLLVQQYEQFTILEEESIDSGFARFNTIITSLKALDEGFSSKNYVRKFLRALHPKWRAKVTAIEESKDLSSLALDELIGNLKVHEVVMKKDSKIYKGKKERIKSIAMKVKKESSDDETSTSGSDDEEYAMARAKVTAIEESKDLSSLSLDELISNLKVHEVVMEKDSEIYKGKKKRVKSISLKAKKESSDDETSTSGSDDEEYAMAVRNFKKFFRRKGKFVRQAREEKKSFRQRDEKKGKSCRKCFRRDDPNHLIDDCPKPSHKKDQKAFIGGSWSDNENVADDKTNDETCLMAQSSNEVCLRTCLEPDEWIKHSGCSKHMTGNKSLFSTYKAYDGGNVVFGSNLKGKIIGKCTISNDSLTISNVEHVDNLAFNLLSVGQICDNKFQVLFTEEGSEIIKDGKIIGNGIRKNGLYIMKLGNKS
ncbi:hypothetical protein Tco_0631947 [Tanacetum coccineum]